MKTRSLHKIVGLTLLIPFLAWIFTAMVFYLKPGYAEAYAFLEPKTYPLTEYVSIHAMDSTWLELKYMKTILGTHVLVLTKEGWMQLESTTLHPRGKPNNEEMKKLLNDAFSQNPQRYGEVASISNDTIMTTTGIQVSLDWNGLKLYQRGPDTDRIDLLYKIHYLQWTGIRTLDKILGPLGLTLVFLLSILGIRLAIKNKQS
jgi:hypothetical protein